MGLFFNRLKNTEPPHQVYLGHVPKVFREPIRSFHDLLVFVSVNHV
jgi:hypothetical protein